MANRYWVASSAGNWSDTANWSTTSGGSGGASVPGGSDNAIFDSNGPGDCNNAAGNIAALQQNSSYTGTLTVTNSFNLNATGNVIGGNLVLGGTYGNIRYIQNSFITLDIQSTASITGGTGSAWYYISFSQVGAITIDPAATVSMSGGLRIARGTTLTQACNLGCDLYIGGHATFSSTSVFPSGTVAIDGNLIVNGYSGTGAVTFDTATNNTSFEVSGDVTFQNLGTLDWQVGSGTITLDGTAAQAVDFSGDTVNPIIVANTAVGPITLGSSFTTGYVHDCDSLIDLNGFTITETGTDPSPCSNDVFSRPVAFTRLG